MSRNENQVNYLPPSVDTIHDLEGIGLLILRWNASFLIPCVLVNAGNQKLEYDSPSSQPSK